MTHSLSLCLIYSRILDLEDRNAIAPFERDKLPPLYKLKDELEDTGRALTEEEISYHKLSKYLKGCDQ